MADKILNEDGESIILTEEGDTLVSEAGDVSSVLLEEIQNIIIEIGNLQSTIGIINTDIGGIKTVIDKLNTMLESDGDDYKYTEDALSEAPVASDAPSVIAIRQEMDLNSTRLSNLDATISSRSTLTATQVWANSTRTLSSFGTLVADIATGVWGATTRTLTTVANSAGVTTLLSRIGTALTFTNGNVNVHIKGKDNIDFGTLEKTSLNAATPLVTVSDKTGFSLAVAPPTVEQIRNEIDMNSIKLDVAISTRLASDDYEAPDNEAITDIKEITDILDSLIEDSDGNRFTAKALEQTPVTDLTVTDIINGVLDEALLNHQQAGSVGAGIAAAGSAGDPWATILPGTYPEGTAGYVMGTNLLNPGTGNNIWLYRLVDEDTTEPIIGALVVASTDVNGNIIIATAVTDTRGIVRFNLNSGTYYLWRRHVNYEFTDPDIEVVP